MHSSGRRRNNTTENAPPTKRRTKLQRIGWDGLAMLALANLVIAATGGLSLLWQLSRVYAVAKHTPSTVPGAHCLLVLGKRLRNGAITIDYALRLKKAWALQTKARHCRIVVLGGGRGTNGRTEAYQGKEYLVACGVPRSRVILEDRSSNTLENLREARAVLGNASGEHAVLITSRYHLARSHALAASLGLSHTLCAAEERLHLGARILLHLLQEAYYLHWFVVGRAWARLIASEKLLKRIS